MQSISGDDGTYASHMVLLMASMLGLPCQPCLRPLQLTVGDYYFVVAIKGVRLLSHMHLRLCPTFLMRIFALDLSGNCPGGDKSHFTASESESWHSIANNYPPSNYEFVI